MSFADVLVPAITLSEDEPALRTAMSIAGRFDARVAVLAVAVRLGSDFAPRQPLLSDLLADVIESDRSSAKLARNDIARWLDQTGVKCELRETSVEAALVQDEVVAHARMADLTVLGRSEGHPRARRELLADVLFKSGRPVLLAGRDVRGEPKWDRIIIAWSPKPEAVRAIAAAMPLLKAAEVRIVTVDALPSKSGHGEAPGREVAAYLAHRGVRVEVCNIDGLGRSPARAIEEAAVDFAADLIVMGGYGRTQASEFLFGGVTRELIATSSSPLFMAH